MTTLADLTMMRLAALDAVDRGDYETAREMEDALRAAGRDDVADDVYAYALRASLAAGADLAGGSRIIGARVLAAVSHLAA